MILFGGIIKKEKYNKFGQLAFSSLPVLFDDEIQVIADFQENQMQDWGHFFFRKTRI